jgi:hypothetical protein
MSTIAPPPKPINPVLVDSEGYIDQQIRRTRRSLKLLDLTAGVLTLLIGLLGFILVGALIDHWIVPGGLSFAGRAILFGVMLAGVAWYGWRQFVPLLKPINPVYAAQTIERNSPTLKNSLLNLLLFRSHRSYVSPRVYHALEQQTAVKLSSAALDNSIDRSVLLRLGYVLLGVIAAAAIYAALSPKSIARSTARVLAPWADLTAPSRVQIVDVKPGQASVARGERVEVSAEIHGLGEDEPVRLRYSTADGRTIDQSIRMERPAPEARRLTATLPRGADTAVEQDLEYWIEAGDARTPKFKLSVFTRPTIVVQKIHYSFPAYTGLPSKETNHLGDIRGVEGTKVTVGAVANQPIKSAYVDFDADGSSHLPMQIDGDRAMVTFPLELRDDRRTPAHPRYALRFTAVDGRKNADPPAYSIEVTPDYAPEVSITQPEEPEQVARLGDVIPIGVEARDPDFGLKSVTIVGKVDDGDESTVMEMIDGPEAGRVVATKMFTPADYGLKPGDVLEYWAVARDTRPEANIGASEHRRLKIIGPDRQAQGRQPQANQQNQQPNDGQQGGEQGENNGQGSAGGAGGESSEGGDGESQPGAQGAGGQGQEGESGQEGEQGEGGAGGGSGENNDGQSQESSDQAGENGAGGSSGSGGEQDPNSQNDPAQNGSSGGNPAGQQQQQDGNSPADAGAESSQAGGEDSGEAGGQGGKVSSAGDNDAEAFRRMMEHMKEQNQSQDGSGQPGEQGSEQQSANGGQANGADAEPRGNQSAQQNGGEAGNQQPFDGGGAQQDAPSNDGASPQKQGSAGQPRDGEPGEEQQPGAGEQAGSPADDRSSNSSGDRQGDSGQQAAGDAAQPKGPNENAGDRQQQGAAGENQGERNGASQAREAQPGDGQSQQQGADDAPDSAMNDSGGDSGAGHQTGEEQGAPGSDGANRQGTKKNQEDNRPGREDNEAPVGSPDKRESDSTGGVSGEQSGGGQEGGGQQADAAGKGGAGQHQAANEGAGRAQEQGEGDAGSQAGEQQKADGMTGQSSGDQAGNGSQQGEAADPGEQPSEQEGAAGEEPSDAGKQGEPGGQSQQGPGDSQGEQQSPSGNQPGSQGSEAGSSPANGEQGGEPGDGAGLQPPDPSQQDAPPPGEQNDNQQDAASKPGASGSSSSGGGAAGSNAQSSSSESGQLGADEANLDYAREQTNLILEGLDQQLAKKQVDRKLLEHLGWTEAELRQFVDRWKSLRDRAERDGQDADEAKQELDEALQSLGLNNKGPLRFRGTAKADELRANDALRVKAPSEYADRVREYTKGISSQRKD